MFSLAYHMVSFYTLGYEIITHLFWISLITGLFGIWEKEMATHSSTLAWKILWWRSLVGYIVHGGHKESDMTEQLFIYLLFIILASVFRCCDLHLYSLPILALGCLDFLLICNYSLYTWDPKPFWLYALERSSLSLWAIFQFWYIEFKHVNVNSFFYKLCFCLLIKKLFCCLKSWKYAWISYSSNFELLLFKYRSLWQNKCKFKCIILKTQNYGFADIWGIS